MRAFDLKLIPRFKALLFDLDGTLIDSMPAHNLAWQKALLKHQVQISHTELLLLAGVPNLKTAEIFIERYQIGFVSPQEIVRDKETFYEESLEQLRPIEVVAGIANTYAGMVPMGIVSGSTRAAISRSLNQLGFTKLFSCVVSCEDTLQGKPFPDPYQRASELLGIPPSQCLVFEDGAAGIQSARAAEMTVVLVKENQLFWDEEK